MKKTKSTSQHKSDKQKGPSVDPTLKNQTLADYMKKFDKKGKKTSKERDDVVLGLKQGDDKYSSVKSSQKSSNKKGSTKFMHNPTVKKMTKANIILNTQSFADMDFNAN